MEPDHDGTLRIIGMKIPVLCAASVSPLKKDSRSRGSAALLRLLAAACPSPCFRELPAVSLCGRQQATRCQRGFHLLREISVATSGAWQGLSLTVCALI